MLCFPNPLPLPQCTSISPPLAGRLPRPLENVFCPYRMWTQSSGGVSEGAPHRQSRVQRRALLTKSELPGEDPSGLGPSRGPGPEAGPQQQVCQSSPSSQGATVWLLQILGVKTPGAGGTQLLTGCALKAAPAGYWVRAWGQLLSKSLPWGGSAQGEAFPLLSQEEDRNCQPFPGSQR